MSHESTHCRTGAAEAKDTKRTGDYPQIAQITQIAFGPEPNLRNL
jgi:hypothetical protein